MRAERSASRRHAAVLLLLSGLLSLAALSASQQPEQSANGSKPALAGDAACAGCHQAESEHYRQTSHHIASRPASPDAILGSFSGQKSTLTIFDPAPGISRPRLFFHMEVRADGYYQTASAGLAGHEQSHGERIDVVTGSGSRGQSYLYWLGNQLFELPLSYWADGQQWINSPGYHDGTANFSRPVYPRCLECHSTYIAPLSANPLDNHYERKTLVTGISCETCHGPAAEHVAAHRAARAAAPAAILNPARFSRDRQVDLCALCHSGAQREERAPAFSFVPGEPLEKFLRPLPEDTATEPEVHGNQVGLLKKSRCYLASPTMNCSTCHDVHAPERPAAAYSDRCLGCHQASSCPVAKAQGPKAAGDCIDCHMPEQPTKAIVATTAGNVVRARMRTHWIRVYPGSPNHTP